ncbi:MAG: 4Fe-4S ferredoxin [Deltaproteobacteria bacterium]|nr:4Fe-4S ferredoxin [Deltaproteobacteria bacterium]
MKENAQKLITREIIEIDERLCDGCGECIASCAEGALALVEGKAKLVSDTYCDGLGACLGHCPTGALKIIKRESLIFDEDKTMDKTMDKAKDNRDDGPCPGAKAMRLSPKLNSSDNAKENLESRGSGLANWPIQLKLVPPNAEFLDNETLVLASDCTAFASRAFQGEFLNNGHPLVMGCPKLDDIDLYIIKLSEILKAHPQIKELKVAIMSVPCCRGLIYAAVRAIERAGLSTELCPRLFVVEQDGSIQEEFPELAP